MSKTRFNIVWYVNVGSITVYSVSLHIMGMCFPSSIIQFYRDFKLDQFKIFYFIRTCMLHLFTYIISVSSIFEKIHEIKIIFDVCNLHKMHSKVFYYVEILLHRYILKSDYGKKYI